ncbi:MAG: hypothetical protein ABI765_02070 [Gemmatimonadota bacterium]
MHRGISATAVTRGLCIVILALMAAAALYGASMAARYFGQISV